MSTVLIADDDPVLCRNLALALESSGYAVLTAMTAADTLAQCTRADLILLDVMLPDGSGFDCCTRIRTQTAAPVLFLTSCAEEEEIVRGLDCGGDDYITKPFRLQELLARIASNLRRCAPAAPAVPDMSLTAAEEKLLHLLTVHPGQYLTREQILEALWDSRGSFVNDNTLSVHISRLREKLSAAGFGEIRTKRGLGYCWLPPERSTPDAQTRPPRQ